MTDKGQRDQMLTRWIYYAKHLFLWNIFFCRENICVLLQLVCRTQDFTIIQGVPKVCSSNFMHYNFWSKPHFYMKFLKLMFLTLSSTCVQKFSYRHPPFVFLSHSIAVAALSEISHVACRALDDSFWAFLSPSMQESLRPPNNIIF